MSKYFEIARAWLAALDPAAPAAALVLTVFLAIYLLRRFAPGAWLWLESKIPFADALDYRPVATIVWKFVQALPGALLGAAVASLSSGASLRNALFGVLAGFAASLVHEVMAAYKGQVGRSTPLSKRTLPSLAGLMLALCFALFGCGLGAGAFWPPYAHCAPTPAKLLSEVTSILEAGGDYESALEQLAIAEGKDVVLCGVETFVGQLGASTGNAAAAKARGRAFLASAGTKVER